MRIVQVAFVILYLSIIPAFAQDDETIDENIYNQSSQLADDGWTYLSGQSFQDAVDKFTQSIELYDGNADALVGRANALMKLDRLDEAEKDILEALKMSGDEADMYYLAANIYYKMKYYENATSLYTKALDFNETSNVPIDIANCYYNRGNAFLGSGMYRSAINDFTKAIKNKEDFMNAYHNRGLAYKNRDAITEACADFEKAKSLGSLTSEKYIDKYCQK